MNYEEVLNNHKIPRCVRYGIIRTNILEKGKNRAEKRELLMMLGTGLGGKLISGKPNYWVFIDGTKAKFK